MEDLRSRVSSTVYGWSEDAIIDVWNDNNIEDTKIGRLTDDAIGDEFDGSFLNFVDAVSEYDFNSSDNYFEHSSTVISFNDLDDYRDQIIDYIVDNKEDLGDSEIEGILDAYEDKEVTLPATSWETIKTLLIGRKVNLEQYGYDASVYKEILKSIEEQL